MTDAEWLEAECYRKNITPTEAQKAAILEKIGFLHADGWGLNNARHTALSMEMNKDVLA